MTRYAQVVIPEIDDEIEFIVPPVDFENAQWYKLDMYMNVLRECLDIIDDERWCQTWVK